MKQLRTYIATLALAGHCFAILGAYALHGPHSDGCCSTGSLCSAVASRDAHDHRHSGCQDCHQVCREVTDRAPKVPDGRHNEDDCGWCRFLSAAGTEPLVTEPPARGEAAVAPLTASRVSPARPAPALPAVRGPPC